MNRNVLIGEKVFSVASDDTYLDSVGEVFEPYMVEVFQALIGPNDVVVDIGANVGLTALLFSNLAKEVFAFEPSPSTFRILEGNLTHANVDNVDAVNLGLGEKREELTITFANNNRSGGFVSDKIQPKEGHVTEKIQIDSLDNFFSKRNDPISFIKIDVEGFEANVIKGGKGILEKHKPVVVLELNHFCLNALRRVSVPDFFDILRSVFPYLYAVDTDNSSILDLHDEEQAYYVMHEHIVKFRFPNIVAGYSPEIFSKLKALELSANKKLTIGVEKGAGRFFDALKSIRWLRTCAKRLRDGR